MSGQVRYTGRSCCSHRVLWATVLLSLDPGELEQALCTSKIGLGFASCMAFLSFLFLLLFLFVQLSNQIDNFPSFLCSYWEWLSFVLGVLW
ncbi:hypothetical protein BDV28DRAFT_60514 [Aspergillus coremiiformis]|uniref:Uncharacterized protein n=1 Tax=Aspergillus coremiiformis TaxID=138285 RepID=A0A5N6YVG6_9EURO|nr:hypothetical protein BDV28DRAFT_60514 [Aspergillus coremiiformis]